MSVYEVQTSAPLNEYHQENHSQKSLTQPDADVQKNAPLSRQGASKRPLASATTYLAIDSIITNNQKNVKPYKDIILKISDISETNKREKFLKAIESTSKSLNIPFGLRLQKKQKQEKYKYPLQKEIDEALVNLSIYAMDGKLRCTALGNASVYITGTTQDHIKETRGQERLLQEKKYKAKYIPFIPALLANGAISEKSSSKKVLFMVSSDRFHILIKQRIKIFMKLLSLL